jgi:hypothetical protein
MALTNAQGATNFSARHMDWKSMCEDHTAVQGRMLAKSATRHLAMLSVWTSIELFIHKSVVLSASNAASVSRDLQRYPRTC